MKLNIVVAIILSLTATFALTKKRRNKKTFTAGDDQPVPCKWSKTKDQCKAKYGEKTQCDEMLNECRKANGAECYVKDNEFNRECLSTSKCEVTNKNEQTGWGTCVDWLKPKLTKVFGTKFD